MNFKSLWTRYLNCLPIAKLKSNLTILRDMLFAYTLYFLHLILKRNTYGTFKMEVFSCRHFINSHLKSILQKIRSITTLPKKLVWRHVSLVVCRKNERRFYDHSIFGSSFNFLRVEKAGARTLWRKFGRKLEPSAELCLSFSHSHHHLLIKNWADLESFLAHNKRHVWKLYFGIHDHRF